MKTVIRKINEPQLREAKDKAISERKRLGEALVYKLKQRLGKGIEEAYNKHPDKVINLAFAIKNTEEHLGELTESQLPSTLGTTPLRSNFVIVAELCSGKTST